MATNQYQTFFQKYANAIENAELDAIEDFFKLPFILVSEQPKHLVEFDQELMARMQSLLELLEQQGIEQLLPKLNKVFRVSQDMMFVSVQWQFIDTRGEVVKQYTNSYMLAEQQQELKIVTLIVDNKHDLFAQLLN